MATSGSGTSAPATAPSGTYTLAQLVSQWRLRLDDTLEPYLWSNDELTTYADTIQKLVVGELPVLVDTTGLETTEVALVQGDGLVDLSPRITRFISAKLDGEDTFLTLATAEYMNANYPNWNETSVAQDTPTIFVYSGVGLHQGYLYPPLAAVTGTLKLQVERQPLLDLDYGNHSTEYLEIDAFAHLLVHGIMWQAYLKQGADTYNKKLAADHKTLWEQDLERIRRVVLRRSTVAVTTQLQGGWS